MAAVAPQTLSAAVRTVLSAGGNRPLRLRSVWETVQSAYPALAKSRTHFKTQVVAQMFRRGELVKAHVLANDARGRERDYYGMRLKVNRHLQSRLAPAGAAEPMAAVAPVR